MRKFKFSVKKIARLTKLMSMNFKLTLLAMSSAAQFTVYCDGLRINNETHNQFLMAAINTAVDRCRSIFNRVKTR